MSFTATTGKGKPKRTIGLAILARDRSEATGGTLKPKLGSVSLKGFVCPASGRYFVVAESAAGDATQLLGTVSVKAPKKGGVKLDSVVPSQKQTIVIGAIASAKLTLKFAGDTKRNLTATVVSVTDPSGASVPFANFIKASSTGGTLTMTLGTSGTWTVVVGATSTTGSPGKYSSSYTVKQGKLGYSAD